ncbi:MAG: beta-propeller fold lactonase family protein [Candidatus Sulfotelmatobacter sp.]
MSVAVDPSGNFAYVADFNGNGTTGYVSAYTINSSTGALTAITGSPFTAGNQPESVMVDPSGSSVCVANFFDNTVSGYSIDSSTGALTALSGSPYKTGNNTEPFSVTVDPTGQFLCEANALANTVACFSIDPHIRKSDSAGNQHGLLLERRPRLSRWTHQANSSMSPIRAEAYPHSAPAVP